MEVWRRAVGVGDMEAWIHGAVELCRCAADLGTWRYGGMEFWSFGGALLVCRREVMEVWGRAADVAK